MLPIWLVSIRMNSAKKAFRVALVFSSGLFVIAIDIIRVVSTCPLNFFFHILFLVTNFMIVLYRTMLSEDL